MKKVLILANDEYGLFHFRYHLIKKLISLGNQIYLSTPILELEEEFKSIGCHIVDTKIERRAINPITDIKLIKFYYETIRKIKPDIIITYTIKPNIYGNIAASLCKTKSYANITGLGTAFNSNAILKIIATVLYKLALRNTKIVYFENVMNRDLFVKSKIVKEENTVVLNGAGVDLEKFSYSDPKERDETIFLFMSRIMKEKGIDELLDAIKKIKCEYKDKVIFNFLGSQEENYSEIINEYINNGYINYFGTVKNVRPYIDECDSVVLPSYHEGMSNTLLEAAASGRIIVTSNIHGCKESVINGETGFLAEVKNSNDLYDKLIKVINLNYETKLNMSKKARLHIEKTFDKNKVVNETIKNLDL